MKYCPITYEPINHDELYSTRGLRMLSPQLKQLNPLNLSSEEQRKEAITRAGKMSIQGIQPKLSAQLKIKEGCFEIVDRNGHYILKTPSELYDELPENEAISMTLAKEIGLDVPLHGLLYASDSSMTYFIKRFDRKGHTQKIAVEDFAQLLELDRDTKYQCSMERAITVIEKYCTYPKIEFVKFFKLTLFNFLIGNEDMHLKNFSLISNNELTTLSPAYDLLNTSIALRYPEEEIALSIHGKKKNLKKETLIDYFGKKRLGLNEKVIAGVLTDIHNAKPKWQELLNVSFLSKNMKTQYIDLLNERFNRLG